MLKGHAKIELTNVKTGEVKTYEHDNFVTNLFKDAMQPCGCFGDLRGYFANNHYTAKNALLSIAQGVALFDAPVGTTADDYTLPAGVNMVGRGANIAYNGTDTTMGSFSESESILDNDGTATGYKFVWDFTTKQANGTIQSICLCPPQSAKLGYGKANYVGDNNVSMWDKGLQRSNDNYQVAYPNDTKDSYSQETIWVDFSGNRMLVVTGGLTDNSRSTGNLYYDKLITISEYRIALNNRSIFDSYDNTERNNMTPQKTYQVEMPESLQTLCDTSIYQAFETRVDPEAGTLGILLLPGEQGKIEAGGIIYIWRIDLKTMTSTVETYTNNTGYAIGGSSHYMSSHCIFELKNYILVHVVADSARKLFCIAKSNGECREVTMMDGGDIPFSDATNKYWVESYWRKEDLLIAGRGSSFLDSSKSTNCFMVDGATATIKFLNSNLSYSSNQSAIYKHISFSGSRKYMTLDSSNTYLYPFVFFTINNLDAPIEKTDDQAMKITYTLTKQATE